MKQGAFTLSSVGHQSPTGFATASLIRMSLYPQFNLSSVPESPTTSQHLVEHEMNFLMIDSFLNHTCSLGVKQLQLSRSARGSTLTQLVLLRNTSDIGEPTTDLPLPVAYRTNSYLPGSLQIPVSKLFQQPQISTQNLFLSHPDRR
jgi:hypothetical protein